VDPCWVYIFTTHFPIMGVGDHARGFMASDTLLTIDDCSAALKAYRCPFEDMSERGQSLCIFSR
jgi:hypothetical protein